MELLAKSRLNCLITTRVQMIPPFKDAGYDATDRWPGVMSPVYQSDTYYCVIIAYCSYYHTCTLLKSHLRHTWSTLSNTYTMAGTYCEYFDVYTWSAMLIRSSGRAAVL
jgi:hypothetical protein